MTAAAIRNLPTASLRQVVNGMAFALGYKWADHTARDIAVQELNRRAGR